MTLPADFRFSQASLQDFAACRRRFQLRYVERLDWPALESQPALEHERQMQLGAQFHLLVQQHQSGIDAAQIEASIRDAELLAWWSSYLAHPVPDLPAERRPEYVLTVPLGGYRLLAKYDLLATEPGGRAVIVDWKTGAKAPPRSWLARRQQTLVYRYVLAEAGARFNGGAPLDPEQVSLVYWFTARPEEPEVFEYSAAEHARAGAELAAQIETIASLPESGFPLTDDERACRFCVYRSLCGRGGEAGSLADLPELGGEEAPALDLDLEQIAEIEF